MICEGENFTRHVEIQNPTKRMLLVTAISKPSRLDAYLPSSLVGKVTFKDHYMYNENELEMLLNEYQASSILTTQKDAVKMATFDIPLSILKLDVEISAITKANINALLAPKR